ncbi:MAG: hypothetical protein EPN20_07325 [Magnetospirillum sp.]|nr:MAG: hypothetical protein EPN20_07325 [Magnetospirillum sp.]
MNTRDDHILTFDIDWAADWAIDRIAERLIDRRVKATWFVTHACAALDRLRRHPELFELGIHPNCLPGSSHGATEDDVLTHVLDLVPGATSMRSHCFYQSTPFLAKAWAKGIRMDSSILVPGARYVSPHILTRGGMALVRLPVTFEDDIELSCPVPSWSLAESRFHQPGLKVFNFHPMVVALNPLSDRDYDAFKNRCPLAQATEAQVEEARGPGPGPEDLLCALIEAMTGGGVTMSDIAKDAGV